MVGMSVPATVRATAVIISTAAPAVIAASVTAAVITAAVVAIVISTAAECEGYTSAIVRSVIGSIVAIIGRPVIAVVRGRIIIAIIRGSVIIRGTVTDDNPAAVIAVMSPMAPMRLCGSGRRKRDNCRRRKCEFM